MFAAIAKSASDVLFVNMLTARCSAKEVTELSYCDSPQPT